MSGGDGRNDHLQQFGMQRCRACHAKLPLELQRCTACETLLATAHAVAGDRTSYTPPTLPPPPAPEPHRWPPIPTAGNKPPIPLEFHWRHLVHKGDRCEVGYKNNRYVLFVYRTRWTVDVLRRRAHTWVRIPVATERHSNSDLARTTCEQALLRHLQTL